MFYALAVRGEVSCHHVLDNFQWPESPLDEQQIRQLASGGLPGGSLDMVLADGTAANVFFVFTRLPGRQ